MEQTGLAYTDTTLAVMELQRDLLFHKIPKGQVKAYVDRSLSEGVAEAERYMGQSLDELCAARKLSVRLTDQNQGMGGVSFRASISYGKDGAEMTLFTRAIEDLLLRVNPLLPEGQQFTFDGIRSVMVAHEFFHYLEFTEIGEVPERAGRVDILPIFGRRRQARIMRCSEVAAHAFAKAFLGLPFLPNLTDYLYFVATGKWTMEELDRRMAYAAALYEAPDETRPRE